MRTPTARLTRPLAVALTLPLLLPAAALAQEPETTDATPTWPTADELRLELQDLGYAFEFDGYNMAVTSEWSPDVPAVWRLTEPAIVDDAMPDGADYEGLTLRLVDAARQPVQLIFGATSADRGAGELDAIATVLMEVSSRLPEGSGLDAFVWFLANTWVDPGIGAPADLPCLVQEFDGGAMVAWRGADGEGLESVFGTIQHGDGAASQVEQCRAAQAQAASEPAASATPQAEAPTTDFTVPTDEAVALIESGDYTVIDVRTPAEYEQAHVVGAINMDVESADFADQIAELDPEGSYIVYCRSGRRSALAADQMATVGFTHIVDAGGLADLARAGAPVE